MTQERPEFCFIDEVGGLVLTRYEGGYLRVCGQWGVKDHFDSLGVHRIQKETGHLEHLSGKLLLPATLKDAVASGEVEEERPIGKTRRDRYRCCDNEKRSMAGGCISCGDPCF